MGLGLLDRLDQLVDDVRRRRHVRIAHAEIDDVDALGAQPCLDLVDLFEDVRGQAADTVKIAHGGDRLWNESGWENAIWPIVPRLSSHEVHFFRKFLRQLENMCTNGHQVSTMALRRSRRPSQACDIAAR